VSCRQRDELVSPADEKWIASHNERTNALLHKLRNCAINFAFRAGVQNDEVVPEGAPPLASL